MAVAMRYAIAAGVLVLAGCSDASAGERIGGLRATMLEPEGSAMVVAHRACWKNAPENSLASIADCGRIGVEMIEIDVRRTADGHLVLMHDSTVDRTTDGTGDVAAMTLAQLRQLRLRAGAGGAGAALTAERVPTLEEAMLAARGQMLVNLDMKAPAFADAETLLRRLDMFDHVVAGTGVPLPAPGDAVPGLVRNTAYKPVVAQKREPDFHAAWEGVVPHAPAVVELVFTDFAWFDQAARRVREQGSRIWVNTLNPRMAAGHVDGLAARAPAEHWGPLLDKGVSMIQTDEPGALKRYLSEREALTR